jgi:omega-amidase
MQLACGQLDIAWLDKPANYHRANELVASARLAPGTLLLLPEMFATGFTMDAAAAAEPADGPTARFLAELAREHKLYVQAGVVVAGAAGGKPRNEAMVFDPGGRLIARYAKLHLFSYAREDQFYAPGDAAVVYPVGEAVAAPAICYDLRFPELFRAAARRGAELLAVIACWPTAREEHWLALLRARAIENQCYVAAANRCGNEPSGLSYSGRSQIIDPWGRIVADAGGGEGVIRADVDLALLREYREKFPAIGDMRPDL